MKTKSRSARPRIGRTRSAPGSEPRQCRAEGTRPSVRKNLLARQPVVWETGSRIAIAAVVPLVGLWAYWPSLIELVGVWVREPDYSHGFFVLPLAVTFLWFRRSAMPAVASDGHLLGAVLLALSVAMRYLGARYFLSFMEGWSLVVWVAAVITVFAGRRILWWAFPAIGFLVFMTPLPYSAEGLLSQPLQRVATKLSSWTLQLVGLPAFAEGNVILLDEHRLEVAQACSGLRLFVSVFALAYAYALFVKRERWEKLILLACAAPIAVVANAFRIVGTGLFLEIARTPSTRQFSHDLAGWLSIPVAAGLFWLTLWYLGRAFESDEVFDSAILVRERRIFTTSANRR